MFTKLHFKNLFIYLFQFIRVLKISCKCSVIIHHFDKYYIYIYIFDQSF